MKQERKAPQEMIYITTRDMTAKELNRVLKDFCGLAIINGDVYLNETLHLPCDFHVNNVYDCSDDERDYDLHIDGDLVCYGELSAANLYVMGKTEVKGQISTGAVSTLESVKCEALVGEDIYVEGDLDCSQGYIFSHGDVQVTGVISAHEGIFAKSLQAEKIISDNDVIVRGKIYASKAMVSGEMVAEKVTIG